MKTNFQKVKEFNEAFEVETLDIPDKNIFENNKKLVDYRLNLILEEVNELKEAIKTKDFTETIDALTDILYVTYGAFTAFGVNADTAFDIVQESNMSKICKTEEEAKNTVKWYLLNEKDRYDSPDYKLSKNGKDYIVYNKNTKKILKNINYKPANFRDL